MKYAEVRKAPKRLTYTIKRITDIDLHRALAAKEEVIYQNAKEAKWKKTRLAAIKMVEEQISTFNLTDSESYEARVRNSHIAICSFIEPMYGAKLLAILPPKLTRFEKLKLAAKRLWLTAFPE